MLTGQLAANRGQLELLERARREGTADLVRQHDELQGVPVEEIARLAGHASSRTTEVVYRRELRPVITTGAGLMDQIFQPKERRGTSAEAAG
jgi:hypothetical protein